MHILFITALFAIVVTSCGPRQQPIKYPGLSKPLGYVTVPSRWERKGISDGGRTANLFVPRSLNLEVAENSTRPAISIDLIGTPNGKFPGPYNQTHWVDDYVAGQAYQYAHNMKVEEAGQVTNAQFGPIKLFRATDKYWGDRLIATLLNSDGWHLFELKTNSAESLSDYRGDFISVIQSTRMNNGEQAAPEQPLPAAQFR